MTLYAVGQQTISTPPNQAYPGDYYGVPGKPGTSTAATGFIGISPIQVGQFAWVVDSTVATNPQATFLQGSNTRPVFVPRTNANTYDNADLAQGWSYTIPLGYQFEACSNGSFYCAVQSLNSGNTVNVGDTVYIKTSDGSTWISTNTPGAGYYATNYTVSVPNIPNSFGLILVVISNVNAI